MVEKIKSIPLREVWVHEAMDFTPWLLNNLDFLNVVLPFDLIEAEREKAAGTSWVDIVAKDADGGIVVIENQLGTSDHDHLGKVLTYLATYEAKRAIWIVRDARPEHIQAINWLNELGPVDFFLVRAETFRIGDSEPAVVFTLITGPSDPLRTAGDTKRRQVSRKSQFLLDIIDKCKFFDKLTKTDRKNTARSTDYAVRLLWHRTEIGLNAFDPHRAYTESLDFIGRHPRILECVKHIHEVNGKANQLGRYLSTGYAAGLLYLMGSSATNPKAYHSSDKPNEVTLDWSFWNKACDFFTAIAGSAEQTQAVRMALDRTNEDGGLSNAERWAIIIKAWLCYSTDKDITDKNLELEYLTDDFGVRILPECPTVGGIDLGEPSEASE